MKHENIANELSSSREVVSRILKKIEIYKGKIKLINLK